MKKDIIYRYNILENLFMIMRQEKDVSFEIRVFELNKKGEKQV